MKISNPSKAFILLVGLCGVILLLAIGKIPTDAGLPIITATVFYAIGNGVAAAQNVNVDPVIGKRKDQK